MLNKAKILESARKNGRIHTKDFLREFKVSRQYVGTIFGQLIQSGELIKIGSTRNASYVSPEYLRAHPAILPNSFSRRLKNAHLEEHKVLAEIENRFPQLTRMKEHTKAIFDFAFSEMLNNAIEHSRSKSIVIEISLTPSELWFIINDSGIGAFRNIMHTKKLNSELEAIQDLLKGKTTTIPKSHTGQGIFFTSKAADVFVLDSFGEQLTVDNIAHDVKIRKSDSLKRGTRVIFKIRMTSHRHLSDVFKEYTNLEEESDYGFDKTDIRVKLYTTSGINISRSQARRILHGLEKFKIVLLDFDKVPMIGQAFADEIYRVFHNKHPDIKLQETNANEAVAFMIKRARGENVK